MPVIPLVLLREVEGFKQDIDVRMGFLTENVKKLSDHDRSFAISLCNYFAKNGLLSAAQLPYAVKFWKEVSSITAAEPKMKGDSDVAVPTDTSALLALFETASVQGLKFPHLLIPYEEGRTLKVYQRVHKNHGNIAFVFKEATTVVLAEIDREGVLRWKPLDICPLPVRQFIKSLLAEPVKLLAMRGQETKLCCFCGLELTHADSLDKGYGPICAGKWGLPWGESDLSTEEMLDQL